MKLKKIKVETAPNGYSLEVGNNAYFYYNANDLMEGVMYHVGLEIENACSKEIIQDMLTAAINWKDNKMAVAEIKRLNDEIASLSRKLKSAEHTEEGLRNRISNMVSDIKEVTSAKKPDVTTMLAALKAIARAAGNRTRKNDELEEDEEL